MGSNSKTSSTNLSTEYSNSLNRTVTGTVGQGGLGLFSGGNISGSATVDSFNSPTTLSFAPTTSNVSNLGSGSVGTSLSSAVSPAVSAGTQSPSVLTNLAPYLPWILLALGLGVVFYLFRKP